MNLIFCSEHSIGRSLLSLEEATEIDEKSQISVFSIAKAENLKTVTVFDSGFSGFIKAYKNAKKLGVKLQYGIKFIVCQDLNDKSEDSLKTESKVVIGIKNAQGYKDLIKLYTKSWKDGKYYKNRLDWSTIKSLWTPNLILFIPFYDSFLHSNLLLGKRCTPEFPVSPIFFSERHNLPFDYLIQQKIDEYCKMNNFVQEKAHTVFYYKNDDFVAYQCLRIACSRGENGSSTLNNPNIPHCSSSQFSFESYKNLCLK